MGKDVDDVGGLRHGAESLTAIEQPSGVHFARLGCAGKSGGQQTGGAGFGENRGEQLVRSDDLIRGAWFVGSREIGFHQVGRERRDVHVERDRRRRTSLRELFSRDDPAEYSGARATVLLWCDQTVEAGLLELGVVFVGSGALLIVLEARVAKSAASSRACF